VGRPFIVAANWKMHKSPREAVEFLKDIRPRLAELPAMREVIFFVPAVDLWVTQEALQRSNLKFGGQNCFYEMKGAFTGENSPAVLAEIGATYCLVGHSERRTLFHETDEDTARKVKALHAVGITPMLCVGETLEEREKGITSDVIVRQLREGFKDRDSSRPVTVAYEPVWAIGTGKVATPEQAGEAHAVLRKALAEIGGDEFAAKTPILYGGSVKPENAEAIARQEEVDGFLVGGASLEVSTFLPLCLVSVS